MNGYRIVLAASRTESNEFQQDCWIQMLFATLPANVARYFMELKILKNELRPDGQAAYVPNGLRVVESILLQHFSREDVAVCYVDQFDQFIGTTPGWLVCMLTALLESPLPLMCMRNSPA